MHVLEASDVWSTRQQGLSAQEQQQRGMLTAHECKAKMDTWHMTLAMSRGLVKNMPAIVRDRGPHWQVS